MDWSPTDDASEGECPGGTVNNPEQQRLEPFKFMRYHNFGAAGRQGTLSVARSSPAVSHTFWTELQAYVCASSSLRCNRQIIVFCASLAELGGWPTGGSDESIVLAMSPGGAPLSHPDRRPILVNFGDPVALAEVEEANFAGVTPRLVIVSGILERLVDPRPLLRALRRLLKRNTNNRLVVATLDRGRLAGANDPSYVRLWSSEELVAFLAASGFELVYHKNADSDRSSILISELRCSCEYYGRFLSRHNLPSASNNLVLYSTDEQHPYSDNIERYVAEVARTDDPPIVLTIGEFSVSSLGRQHVRVENLLSWPNAWLAPERLLEPWLAPESLLEAVLHVIFLYDSVDCIEFPDYGGLFFRIPAAKRSGLLPPQVLCLVVCHGNSFYVERMTERFQGVETNLRHLWEKIAIELADTLLFPTNYVYQLYRRELGLNPLGTTLVQQLPFHSDGHNQPLIERTVVADTVVFLGTQMDENGWPEFREAAQNLLGFENTSGHASARRFVAIGKRSDGPLPEITGLNRLEPDLADLPGVLETLAPRSIVVVAKALCGYPYPLMQAIDAGCSVLTMAAGGVHELIPPGFHDHVMSGETANELGAAIRRQLALDPSVRAKQASALRDALHQKHKAVLELWHEQRVRRSSRNTTFINTTGSPVSVVVPVYNRPFTEIQELIAGINAQTLLPREVIFVDDCSDEDFAMLYANAVIGSLRVPARFIRHARNKGLSAARNTGLHACCTEFVAMHDSDNVAGNDFLYRGCLALATTPDLDAVTFEIMAFVDGDDWTTYDSRRDYYRPVGDGVIQSLADINWFGDAMAVYRVETIRNSGGWDECDRAMWEDFALFMKLAVSGRRVMNAPRAEVFYRLRPFSMLRTGSEYAARQRLARVLSRLTPFDAFCLQRLVLTHRMPPKSMRELLIDAVRRYLDDKPLLLRVVRLARAFARRARIRNTHGKRSPDGALH